MGGVAVAAHSGVGIASLDCLSVNTIEGFFILVDMAARTDLVELQCNITTVDRREGWVGIFAYVCMTLNACISLGAVDRVFMLEGVDIEIQGGAIFKWIGLSRLSMAAHAVFVTDR